MGWLRLAVWGIVALLVTMPAVRLAETIADGVSHHASMKSPRSSPGGWRTLTAAPGLPPAPPVLAPRRTTPPGSVDRLVVADPLLPFHPPRG
jgi:hypothetical protein